MNLNQGLVVWLIHVWYASVSSQNIPQEYGQIPLLNWLSTQRVMEERGGNDMGNCSLRQRVLFDIKMTEPATILKPYAPVLKNNKD